MLKDIEKHNFTYDGCEIEFRKRVDDDIDVVITRGNLRRVYQLSDLKVYETYTINGYRLSFEFGKRYIPYEYTSTILSKDHTKERIEKFKEMIMKGEVELP